MGLGKEGRRVDFFSISKVGGSGGGHAEKGRPEKVLKDRKHQDFAQGMRLQWISFMRAH